MTILDAELLFSEDQAITATAASENIIDSTVVADIGVGNQMYIMLLVTTAFTDSGDDSTVTVTLETDDNAAFASATVLKTLTTFAAETAAGTIVHYALGPDAYEEFLRLNYTLANGNLTTGAITAAIVLNIQEYTAYASGFTVT